METPARPAAEILKELANEVTHWRVDYMRMSRLGDLALEYARALNWQPPPEPSKLVKAWRFLVRPASPRGWETDEK
jgi:hypothetical protein